MLGSCDGLRFHHAKKDAIIVFCAPLLRQLPLCSPLCHSLFTEKSILDGGSHVFLLMLLRISARV